MTGKSPLSLRDRVSLAGLGVLAAWVVLLTAAVNGFVSAELRHQADDILTARAQAAATTIEFDSQGKVTVRDTAPDAAIDVGTWIFAGATIVERPVRGSGLDSQAAQLVDVGPQFQETDGIRWYAEPVISDGSQKATVVTSLSLASYRSAQRTLLLGTAALGMLLLMAVWLTLRAGVGRALRPVAEMTHQSARWSADDVDRRFGPGPRPAELGDLAATLDGLLDRLSGVIRHEKQLSAEISHELRTPVTRILAEVELLRRHDDSPEAASTALNSIESSAQEMQQVLEVLMTAARSESSTVPGRCEVMDVLHRVGQTHRRQGIEMRIAPAGPIFASVDGALLERAMNPIWTTQSGSQHISSRFK